MRQSGLDHLLITVAAGESLFYRANPAGLAIDHQFASPPTQSRQRYDRPGNAALISYGCRRIRVNARIRRHAIRPDHDSRGVQTPSFLYSAAD